MDDLHGTGPTLALDVTQTNSTEIRTPWPWASVAQWRDWDHTQPKRLESSVAQHGTVFVNWSQWRTVRDKCFCEGDEATNEGFMDATETVGTTLGRNPCQRQLFPWSVELTMTHTKHSCESGRTVIGLETTREGEVIRVRKLKLMDGCLLYSASRKQKTRAHSSGEYYAAASFASEAMFSRDWKLGHNLAG